MKIVVEGEKKSIVKSIVRWFSQKIYNLRMRWLDFRGKYIRKYQIVDCTSPENGYRGGWMDRSELFLYANFAILCDFMENEYPGYVDWRDESLRDSDDELHALYNWWKFERSPEEKKVDKLLETLPGEPDQVMRFVPTENPLFSEMVTEQTEAQRARSKEWIKRRDELDQKDEEMLQRLLKVRGVMWT